MFHITILRCGATIKVLTSDLTLQGGHNQHDTYLPVGLYEPTIPLPASNYRTAPPTYSQPSPTRDNEK